MPKTFNFDSLVTQHPLCASVKRPRFQQNIFPSCSRKLKGPLQVNTISQVEFQREWKEGNDSNFGVTVQQEPSLCINCIFGVSVHAIEVFNAGTWMKRKDGGSNVWRKENKTGKMEEQRRKPVRAERSASPVWWVKWRFLPASAEADRSQAESH